LENQLPLPEIDDEFYYLCLNAVCVTEQKKRDPVIDASIQEFDALRTTGTKVNICGYTNLLKDLRIVLATMATNHLSINNLRKRVLLFLRWKYPSLKGQWTKIADVVLNLRQADLSVAAQVAADELRDVVTIREDSKPHELLPLFAYLLQQTEYRRANECGKFKGKLFNLLPMKQGYTIANIPFSSNTMGRMLLKNGFLKQLTGYGTPEEVDGFWRRFFSINLVETAFRRFGYMILSDGRSVSIKMQRYENLRGTKKYTEEEFQEFYRLGCRTIGIDPGVSAVVTGIDSNGSIIKYTSSRYYEKSKVYCTGRMISKWNAETADIVSAMPSSKTCNLELLKDFARVYLQRIEVLLQNRMDKGYRNARFMRFVNKQKALNDICDLIAPPGANTIVGFGNWRGVGNTPISRRCSGPVSQIKKCLCDRTHVKLLEIDEFRTSCRCSCCHQPMVNMRAFTNKRKFGELEFSRSETPVKIHSVLHCTNSDCALNGVRMGTMNRDVNGCRNIHMLLRCRLDGNERPEAFRRQPNTVPERLQDG
jgi:hypothetical protein